MAGNPPLLEPVRRSLRLRHYSIRTERAYLDWIRRFILFHHKRHPSGMGSDEIRQFLSHVAADRAVAAATQNQPLSALLYLYREVLGVELSYVESIERAKRPARVPVVLIREEANSILSHMHGTYRLMARLLYGSGQRLMECVRLRIKDVDFGYRQVTVRAARCSQSRSSSSSDATSRAFAYCTRMTCCSATGASTCPTLWSGSIRTPPQSGSGSGSSPPAGYRRTRAPARCAATTPRRTCYRRRRPPS
jgi:site-specific recombinase XerD